MLLGQSSDLRWGKRRNFGGFFELGQRWNDEDTSASLSDCGVIGALLWKFGFRNQNRKLCFLERWCQGGGLWG